MVSASFQSNGMIPRLRNGASVFTAAERKLMATLFANYPMAGLVSITEFAREAGVSTPSVLRLAKKLGFAGFPSFQERLRAELSAQLQNPITKHDKWSAEAPDTHILNTFATAAMENLSGSLKLMDHRAFDAIVALLADRKRSIHIAGGRITGHIAAYLYTHLQMARPGVSLVPPTQSFWPQYLLDIGKQDVVVFWAGDGFSGCSPKLIGRTLYGCHPRRAHAATESLLADLKSMAGGLGIAGAGVAGV